jgi:hypothetical protein
MSCSVASNMLQGLHAHTRVAEPLQAKASSSCLQLAQQCAHSPLLDSPPSPSPLYILRRTGTLFGMAQAQAHIESHLISMLVLQGLMMAPCV